MNAVGNTGGRLTVAVGVGEGTAVCVASGVAVGAPGQPLRAALTAMISSPIIARPSSFWSIAVHSETADCPRAIATDCTSSLILTVPPSLQSPGHDAPAGRTAKRLAKAAM